MDADDADVLRDLVRALTAALGEGGQKADDGAIQRRLGEHFATDPARLFVLGEQFSVADRPNVQRALEATLLGEGADTRVLGVPGGGYEPTRLVDLAMGRSRYEGVPMESPVEYEHVLLDDGRPLPCFERGLLLTQWEGEPVAVLVQGPPRIYSPGGVTVEVMARDRARCGAVLAALRRAARAHDVYRGKVISVALDDMRQLRVDFHRVAPIRREDIVLPPALLDRIEQHASAFARHRETLLAAGRHLKRGILLHGPPGTGKTLTAMYLAQSMPERTTLVLTGRTQGLLEEACRMARMLAPAMVLLEDVDLIAEDRRKAHQGCAPLLFELLNQMDGVDGDADIVFLLTTNRPEILEPALAARPGRIDLAVEVPLPDAACRRQLFGLYAAGLTVAAEDLEALVARTEGASGAFIRELLRKATLIAADDGRGCVVGAADLEGALRALVVGGALTRSLLGAATAL